MDFTEKLKNQMLKYLKSMVTMRGQMGKGPEGFQYLCQEDFILKNAEHFKVSPYPPEYDRLRGRKKECFKNAFELANRYPETLRYVEGYGISTTLPFPIHHAFCVDNEGNVIDPTWSEDQEDHIYFGVVFNLGYVRETILRTGVWGVLENWIDGHPLIEGRKGHTKKEFGFIAEV